jgi:hydrogenase maturation protein HypF
MKRLRIEVSGVVQGVGFRPFVYGLAREMGMAGFVRNSSAGVEIEVEGKDVEAFLSDLRTKAPPLADIVTLDAEEAPFEGDRDFAILASRDSGRSTYVSPDVGTCDDCLRELKDPADRRHGYPFINCTNCGPRYSITKEVPYDRPNTTMAPFTMCGDCRREYDDPLDRRFHAQPNACHVCGPRTEFVRGDRRCIGKEAVEAAVELLRGGGVVAVKGVGGYHLAADAGNEEAVAGLRERKRRSNKAFALMARDVEEIRRFAHLSAGEEGLLLSVEKPIVLLRRRDGTGLSEAVAPGVPELGFMLPYSPLHALLFVVTDAPRLLVMTSGNLSEEPVVKDSVEAEEKLSRLADAFLHHDREIFMRVDDSVVRRFGGQTVFIRRSRGYVPSAIPLKGRGPQLLACGADLKNTFCLTTEEAAVVSQHIGDMENQETLDFFEETLENLKAVYRVAPSAVAHDLHPRYFSTRWALEQEAAECHGIQHHYAHVGSVMAEAGLEEKVIGVALDGSGYGGDGTVWGGEFLVADRLSFERGAHFRAVPMPGGEAAARNPWQMALSYLADARGEEALAAAAEAGLLARSGGKAAENVLRIRENSALSPLTSGAGRLFESVSSLLGLRDVNTFEGEAAMALEAAVRDGEEGVYPFDISGSAPAEVSFAAAIDELLRDAAAGTVAGVAAARFHNTVAAAVVETVRRLHEATGIRDAALTGGVFQNRYLLSRVVRGLSKLGMKPHANARVPANDAGISLGQAFLLRSALRQ